MDTGRLMASCREAQRNNDNGDNDDGFRGWVVGKGEGLGSLNAKNFLEETCKCMVKFEGFAWICLPFFLKWNPFFLLLGGIKRSSTSTVIFIGGSFDSKLYAKTRCWSFCGMKFCGWSWLKG